MGLLDHIQDSETRAWHAHFNEPYGNVPGKASEGVEMKVGMRVHVHRTNDDEYAYRDVVVEPRHGVVIGLHRDKKGVAYAGWYVVMLTSGKRTEYAVTHKDWCTVEGANTLSKGYKRYTQEGK